MKKILLYSVIGLMIVGCSSKKPLEGDRKDIILSEDPVNEKERSLVILDPTSVDLGQTLQLKWLNGMDFGRSKSLRMVSPAIVADGKVFCIDAGGIVYAFNEQTGDLIWRKTTTIKGKDGQVGGALAYSNGKLIVTSSFAEAFAFDAGNGDILWRIKLPACCKGDGITIADGKAYLLCDNSSLQVINIQNGKTLWTHSGMMMDTTYIGSAGVVVKDNVVYLAYPSGEVFALLDNGATLWSSLLSKFSFVNAGESFTHPRACPVIKGNLVYFTNSNQQITAFDAQRGDVVWKKDFGGLETPLISGNSIFVINSSSEVICLNKDNGKIRWTHRFKTNNTEESGWFSFGQSTPPIEWYGPIQTKEGILLISSDGNLVTLSEQDGSVKSTKHLDNFGEGLPSRPVISGNTLYVITNDGSVQAYSSKK